MSFLRRRKKPNMNGVNLLMMLLLCYPELGTVRFEPGDAEKLHLSFALNRMPDAAEAAAAGERINESVRAYHALTGVGEKAATVGFSTVGQGTAAYFNVVRDMETISRGEISLITQLMREIFAASLITDSDIEQLAANEAERLANEENIDGILGTIRFAPITDALVGYREDGRVMVYNK